MMGGSNRRVVGLDFRKDAIHMAEVRRDSNQLTLVRCMRCPTDGRGPDRSGEEELVELLRSMRLGKLPVVCAVQNLETRIRPLALPKMTEAEIEEGLPWQAEKHFGFPVEDTVVDFEPLVDFSEEGERLFLAVVAARRSEVERYLSICKRAGFFPRKLDVAPFAMLRLIAANYPEVSKHVICAVHSYEGGAVVDLLKGKRLLFTLQFDWELAEPQSLVHAIREVLQYFEDHCPTEEVHSLFLLGRPLADEKITSLLEEELELAVKVVDPVRKLTVSEGQECVRTEDQEFGIAVGLAL